MRRHTHQQNEDTEQRQQPVTRTNQFRDERGLTAWDPANTASAPFGFMRRMMDVEVEIANGALYLRGERREEREAGEGQYHRSACFYGRSSGRSRCPKPSMRKR